MAVTIQEIAEKAHVSRGTVDRALNNRKGVNPEVADHVRAIAKELGYTPDIAAKSLANRRYHRKKIGILAFSDARPLFGMLQDGIRDGLKMYKDLGFRIELVVQRDYDPEEQVRLIDQLMARHIDGLALTPINDVQVRTKLQELEAKHIPIVCMNTSIEEVHYLAYVGCDYLKTGYVGADLFGFLAHGEKEEIAVIAGSRENLGVEERVKGFLENIRLNYPNLQVIEVLHNDENGELSYKMTKQLLQRHADVRNICYAGPFPGKGIQAIIDERGKNDLHIITYDETADIKQLLKDGLTIATIGQDPYAQGFNGIQILCNYLLTGATCSPVQQLTQIVVLMKNCLP
ncbi:MAG: LacI family DNA-binding transcriptional regulator [Spirochaetia bacterium]|jgi:LacI family transcriptional regulator|nr:LacI family DNA-binding transcriptional regulator [Spirochaetia bacterium]